MARKHKPEDIIGKLREAEIMLAQGSRAHLYGQVKSNISIPPPSRSTLPASSLTASISTPTRLP